MEFDSGFGPTCSFLFSGGEGGEGRKHVASNSELAIPAWQLRSATPKSWHFRRASPPPKVLGYRVPVLCTGKPSHVVIAEGVDRRLGLSENRCLIREGVGRHSCHLSGGYER